jgi:hypothetical protein
VTEFSRNDSQIVRLEFTQDAWEYEDKLIGKIKVSARSEENDTVNVCDAKVQYDARIALNGKYLTDMLVSMDDNLVNMTLTQPSNPMTFQTGNLLEVVMPMFVQWSKDESDKPVPVPEPEDIEESEVETADDVEHLNEHDRQTVEDRKSVV